MSLNFTVYPGISEIPTYQEVFDFSSIKIREFLLKHLNIKKHLILNGKIQDAKKNKEVCINLGDKFKWKEENFIYVYAEGIPDGIDIYFYEKMSELEKQVWKESMESEEQYKKMKKEISRAIAIEHNWIFKKQAGQQGVMVLLYGILAASLAKLTNGFIYSDDGAWDYNILPAKSDDFFSCYLNPEFAKNNEYKEFSLKNIESLRKTFNTEHF
jgi:hypothetical protein